VNRIGIYLRISDDRDGNQTATQRQEEDCRRYAAGKDWEVADVFEDVDLSAYKRGVKRPEFERMLAAIRHKEIDGVLAWKVDRLTRRQRDLVRLDEECEDAKGFIATVVEGIDTRNPTGRFVAELLVSQARMESENSSIRVKRAHEEQAKKGSPSVGGKRPFGYTNRREIIPEEAELIREATDRVLVGEGIRGVAYDWERRGIKTPNGRLWQQGWLSRLLCAAVISGQREVTGQLYPGKWPAIITPETSDRLRALLAPKPRPVARHRDPRKLLLGGGLARCGRCGGALVSSSRQDGQRRYVCAKQPGSPKCGGVVRLALPVEEVVTQALFLALDSVDLTNYMKISGTVSAVDGLLDLIREDEQVLEQLSRDHYLDRVIGRAEFFAARDAIQTRLEATRSQLAQRSGKEILPQVVGARREVQRRWEGATFEWKRAVLTAIIDHINIMPVGKGGHVFRPESIELVWKF